MCEQWSFYMTPKGVRPNVTVKEASINEDKGLHRNLGHKHRIANVIDMTFLTDLDNAINLSFQKGRSGGRSINLNYKEQL